MFAWKELRLIFNDPLDLLVTNINLRVLKYEKIKLIFF